ncbi:MAG: elongation factor Ts [Alphaproteobacteria bacterium]|nr:elongation factor Ts [Alphaproteobacteria bacterium]
MAEITASLVKELRERTGAGMMDCKKALGESNGVLEEAIDWLRKKGLAAAAKKAGRVAAEGLVAVATSGTEGVVVEVNSETDFVARNDQFQAFAREVAGIALQNKGDFEATARAKSAAGVSVADAVTQMIATIGENLSFRRAAGLHVDKGVVASYVHSAVVPGLGKIGVIVALEAGGDRDKLAAFGKQVAMHIAAAAPQWVDPKDVDTTALDRERAVLVEQAQASGRPANIIEKMVEGRIRKYYEEVTLLEQVFVIDGETKVRKAVENAAKDVGAPITVKGFHRFVLGEGIDKKEVDFAAEVAATAGR